MDDDPERGEGPDNIPKQSGMSQSSKDDIGVCVVIILITILAIIVTAIKIVLFDRQTYPTLFGLTTAATTEASHSITWIWNLLKPLYGCN